MKRCDLSFSRYSRSDGQNLGPKFRIWGSRGTPKGEKICPGPICTIMQNFTPIGATVPEICVTGQRKNTATNIIPFHTNVWRVIMCHQTKFNDWHMKFIWYGQPSYELQAVYNDVQRKLGTKTVGKRAKKTVIFRRLLICPALIESHIRYAFKTTTMINVKTSTFAVALPTRVTSQALYNLGSGSWLAWTRGTAAHYTTIHCSPQRTSRLAVQLADTPSPQSAN